MDATQENVPLDPEGPSLSGLCGRAFRLSCLSAVALALVAAVGWYGTLEYPSGPAEGMHLPGGPSEPVSAPRTIRVGTFNIHSGRGNDGRCDLDRIAGCLKGADFIGLNEVRGVNLQFDEDQATTLGRKLGIPSLFVPTEYWWAGEHFGSGILSSLPVSHWQRIPLSRQEGNGYRNVVLSKVPYQGGTLQILTTHIDRRNDRQHQLRVVIELFLSLREPAILMGDLNTSTRDPQIQALRTRSDITECVGQHVAQPLPKRIDWIFARGLECLDAGVVDVGASDHPHIWADFKLPVILPVADRPAERVTR
jgi:endonuclease/exonuclease/phosphatase family metal-dependent hydrolase